MTTSDTRHPLYFDSSAIAKLLVFETESAALRELFTADHVLPVSSVLTRAEVLRLSARRNGTVVAVAMGILRQFGLSPISNQIIEAAAMLKPEQLRTLDAIHVATALNIGDLAGIVTYDRLMAEAARTNGLTVLAPGAVEDV